MAGAPHESTAPSTTTAAPRRDPRPLPLWRHLLGEELRRRRRERGETLGDTAASAGISPQYLSEIERGVKDPSSEMIDAVAGALGLSLGDLAGSVATTLREEDRRRDAARLTATHPDTTYTTRLRARTQQAPSSSPGAYLLAA